MFIIYLICIYALYTLATAIFTEHFGYHNLDIDCKYSRCKSDANYSTVTSSSSSHFCVYPPSKEVSNARLIARIVCKRRIARQTLASICPGVHLLMEKLPWIDITIHVNSMEANDFNDHTNISALVDDIISNMVLQDILSKRDICSFVYKFFAGSVIKTPVPCKQDYEIFGDSRIRNGASKLLGLVTGMYDFGLLQNHVSDNVFFPEVDAVSKDNINSRLVKNGIATLGSLSSK